MIEFIHTFILEPLLNLLLLLYAVLPGGFGIAIIAMTIVIRLALWPLMKKQTHKQQAMKELQPEMEKIKKKAKGDKQKESQMMMELFKEKEINPLSSIGPTILQLPLLIALVEVFRDMITVEEIKASAYGFIQSLPVIQTIITNPETFDPTLFGYFQLAETSLVLAGIAGITTYFTAKQMSAKKTTQSESGKTPGGALIKIMPFLVAGISATFPAALPLYIATTSVVATFQQYIIMKEEVGLMQKILAKRKSPPDAKDTDSSSDTSNKTASGKSSSDAKNQSSGNSRRSGKGSESETLQPKPKKG